MLRRGHERPNMISRTLPLRLLGCLLWGVLAVAAVAKQGYGAPSISKLSVQGLRIAGATRVVIDGAELLPNPQIVLPFPVASQELQPGATASRVEIEIVLGEGVPVGIHQLRLATDSGISNSRPVGVDYLPQSLLQETLQTLPAALSGSVVANQSLRIRFSGKRGQRVVIDVEARRLGSALDPVVRLLNPRGTQFAWSPPRPLVAGDARCGAELMEDGEYTIVLHDRQFRGGADRFFRLKVGDLQSADLVFPLGVQLGKPAALELLTVERSEPVSATVDVSQAGTRPARVDQPLQFTGAFPPVLVSDHAELLEQQRDDGALQELTAAPVAVNGRLTAPGEEDQFVLPVTPGSKLRFDVRARRAGSPLDGVLTLRSVDGKQLASNDDRPATSDPGLDFTVPAGTTRIHVALTDLQKRGGSTFVYRVSVQDLGRPDFQLALSTDRVNIPADAGQLIEVRVNRQGYQGAIELTVVGLPAGVEVTSKMIAAGSRRGLVKITAGDAKPVHGLISIRGRATDVDPPLWRTAELAENPISKLQPWLRGELAVAVGPPTPISLSWQIADPQVLLRGMPLTVQAQLTRREGVQGDVRLRLQTTQIMPRKKVKKDKKDVMVDDLDRAIRLANTPLLSGDTKQAELQLLVPTDLADRDWGLTLVAELLSADKKTVVQSVPAEVFSVQTRSPLTVELASEAKIEAKAGDGETGRFAGKIVRASGFDHPVTVTLAALPKEYPAPKVVVAGDKDEFSLSVRFPYGTKAGELKNVKLFATAAPVDKKENLLVRSNELTVELKVVPGEKPPGAKLLSLAEDPKKWISYLSKGGGKISLELGDKFSGDSSIKVTPDQRYNELLPGLGLKIRENPAEGEYRYLQFAWKKKGGQSICLQLNHDGNWGPAEAAKPGAKFRYHSGPGPECYGASVLIDKQLPEEFVLVTRDLFADFGEFTLTGLALSPVDGEFGLFDHLFVARQASDLEAVKP